MIKKKMKTVYKHTIYKTTNKVVELNMKIKFSAHPKAG